MRLSALDRVARKAELLTVLEQIARAGEVCPYGAVLARRIDVTLALLDMFLREMRQDKLIEVTSHYCGTGVGKMRRVSILKSGLQTAKPMPAAGRTKTSPLPGTAGVSVSDLERAKNELRRRGHVVFEAATFDKGATKGVIQVGREMLTAEQVIARAAINRRAA